MFARRNAHAIFGQRFPDSRVAQNVVGRRGLLDKPRLEFHQLLHVFDCFRHTPDLVRVDHQDVVRVVAYHIPREFESAPVLLQARANLEFEVMEAGSHGVAQESRHLLVGVP